MVSSQMSEKGLELLRDEFALTALRNGCGVDLYDMLSKGEIGDIGILMYRVADSCMMAKGMTPKQLANP